MGKLDEVLDALMKSKNDIIDKNASEKDKMELIVALREKSKKEIIEEIKEVYKAEIVAEAEVEIKKKENQQKIKQLRYLMWNGFMVAFMVGLAVNQITEILTAIKKAIWVNDLIPTIVFSLICLGICLVLYFYTFIKQVIEMFKDIEKENCSNKNV